MLLPSDVDRVIHIVDAYNAGGLLKEGLALDPRGRKSGFTARLFLIGGLLTQLEKRHLVVADFYRVLTEQIDRDSQVRLGVRATILGPPLFSMESVERFCARLSEKLEYGVASAPDLDPDERQRRRAVIDAVVHALMKATLPERTFSAFALDTSGVWAWGRAPKRAPKDLLSKDLLARELGIDVDQIDADDPAMAARLAELENQTAPALVDDDSRPYERDADWGVKTGKDGRRQTFYGFDLHALVRAPDVRRDRKLEANLIERIAVTPAHTDVVDESLRMIDEVRTSGTPFSELLVDRHYSYKASDRWARPLIERGIEQVLDLHKNDQGFRDYNGAKLAAGWLHCPATPERLGKIVHPGPAASKAQKDQFAELVEEREKYAARRVTKTAPRRFQCPALAGKLGCPLRGGTVEAAREGGLTVIHNPPDPHTAPTMCTASTVSLKEDGQFKLWQDDYWGGESWRSSNNRRTFVEGVFGNIKNPSTENVSRGFFRITGLARVTLFLGIAATAHNLRQLRNWHSETGHGDPSHPLLQPDSATVPLHLAPEDYAAFVAFRRSVGAGDEDGAAQEFAA